jgi:predicted Rossmann fold nucleotide-binding protein DprA/Smf involved in DNA uptake
MTGKERGFFLLTSQLGDPERKPLTVAQFRTLARRVSLMETPKENREITEADLLALGYDRSTAFRIVQLLADEGQLDRYLYRGKLKNCFPVSRAGSAYPAAVRKRLGLDAPGCLWLKGDTSILQTPMISLVGSRDLAAPNRAFARAVGEEAARQGVTLVSGNARGADREAQEACLRNGGRVISVVADELENCPLQENVLYVSEDSFDLPFTAMRALSRNRVIHTLGYLTFVAQCALGKGGTWDGTVKNLSNNWSPVFCFADGSPAAAELEQLGATLIDIPQLSDFAALQSIIQSFL